MMRLSKERITLWLLTFILLAFIQLIEAETCEDYQETDDHYMNVSYCGTGFQYAITPSVCKTACDADTSCLAFNYFAFIPGCLYLDCVNETVFVGVQFAYIYIKCDALGGEDDPDTTLESPACFPNGTIAFENPNPILFTHAMAVQYEGVASAFNCNCTLIGNWAFISGCNTFLDINLFFSNRSMPDEKIFGGVRVTTRSYLIRCYLVDSINRTVGNLITMGMDMTTEDAVTPIFTVSTALRTVNATGDSVTEAYVGDILYWTIDIPSEYTGLPTCTAYSGTSSSGSPNRLLVSEGCSSHNLVLGDFDNKITPYAGTGRIWTTLSTFKFYNSDFIYILCTVTVCPAASSSCDIGCSRRRKRRLVDHNPSNETMTYTTSHWLHIEDKNKAKTLLNSWLWLLAVVLFWELYI